MDATRRQQIPTQTEILTAVVGKELTSGFFFYSFFEVNSNKGRYCGIVPIYPCGGHSS